jgi:hypothetical protein
VDSVVVVALQCSFAIRNLQPAIYI